MPDFEFSNVCWANEGAGASHNARDVNCPDIDTRILVIDDAPEEIRELIVALRHSKYNPVVVTDGWGGYRRALTLRPSLILLDVRMKGVDGFGVCRLLRESPETRRIPIIFLTGADSLEDRLEGLTHGGVDYIVKPFLPDEVVARIRIHLQLEPRESSTTEHHLPVRLSPDKVLLHATMRFIREHLDDLPVLDEIAHKVGTYDKRLSAIFRKHLGVSVFGWVRSERLRIGRQLLADTNFSIQEVAEQVGFQSACNFITAFRERTGVTPSQYRRRIRDDSIHT